MVRVSPTDIDRLGRLIDRLRSSNGSANDRSDAMLQEKTAVSLLPPAIAKLLLVQRRERGLAFGDCAFGEPVWDVMLHLFIAGNEQRRVSASALAAAIDAPQSTVLRWIAIMEERGQLVRRADEVDRRRTFVELAASLRSRVADHLARVGDEMMLVCSEEAAVVCGPATV